MKYKKTFLATAGQRSWKHEDIVTKKNNKATDCCIVQEQCFHWN